MRTVFPRDPDATDLPSGDHATLVTHPKCPRSTATVSPVATVQRRTVASWEPEASVRPSGEKARHHTVSVCPRSVDVASPVAAVHRRTDSSHDPEASARPSGEKATLVTARVWPRSVAPASPVAAAHRRTVSASGGEYRTSMIPEPNVAATVRPSGEKRTLETLVFEALAAESADPGASVNLTEPRSSSSSPDREELRAAAGGANAPPLAAQIRMVRSDDPEATVRLSGDQQTLLTPWEWPYKWTEGRCKKEGARG